MKKQLVLKMQDLLSCTKEEAIFYANQHIERVKMGHPRLNETQCIHSVLKAIA